jgi:hypothetical protein
LITASFILTDLGRREERSKKENTRDFNVVQPLFMAYIHGQCSLSFFIDDEPKPEIERCYKDQHI